MINRLIRACRNRPLSDLPGLIIKNLCYAWEHRNDKDISEFDLSHHVETEIIRETGSLVVNSPNIKYAVRYEP